MRYVSEQTDRQTDTLITILYTPTYTYIGLLCSWQNATNYMIIQIHAMKIAKICKKGAN